MRKSIGVIIGLVLLSLGVASGEVRTWTDISGKFKLEAEFVSLEDGEVTLRDSTGGVKKLPLEKLSEPDRKVANELAGSGNSGIGKARQEESIAAIKKLGGRVGQWGKERAHLSVTFSWDADTEAEVEVALAHLENLKDLKCLELLGPKITNAGLVHLAGLIGLEELNLGHCDNISNAGLVHITGLINLRKLHLGMCEKITDAGFVNLKGLTKLTYLGLNDSNLTGAGFVHLKGLTGLKVLELKRSVGFKNTGLMHLKGHTSLTYLSLRWTKITDSGLAHLKGLTNLEVLDLDETKVTDAGVAQLQTALPKCQISHY